ncbi:unnamed protein product [Clonostachys solani]|uniref:Secreted protein n=1 Tax=Clonostachys solani TaxID=160281 RepID=A0A9N9ZPS8_9HYPO|nr:unnamed protein product [Clonostachys solani]
MNVVRFTLRATGLSLPRTAKHARQLATWPKQPQPALLLLLLLLHLQSIHPLGEGGGPSFALRDLSELVHATRRAADAVLVHGTGEASSSGARLRAGIVKPTWGFDLPGRSLAQGRRGRKVRGTTTGFAGQRSRLSSRFRLGIVPSHLISTWLLGQSKLARTTLDMNQGFSVAQPSCTTVETAAEVPLLLRLSAWVELALPTARVPSYLRSFQEASGQLLSHLPLFMSFSFKMYGGKSIEHRPA